MRVFLLALALLVGNAHAHDEIVVVKLRTPRDPHDARFDPYYDLGVQASFGITGCHRTNVMHPAHFRENLLGKRVAFVQQGFDPTTAISQQRLVFLTPRLTEDNLELVGEHPETRVAIVTWDGTRFRALRFSFAPVLVANDGSGIAALVSLARGTRRGSLVAGFGSLFRTRIRPLVGAVAGGVIAAWESAVQRPGADTFADGYHETMSPAPRTLDTDRSRSFRAYRERATGAALSCGHVVDNDDE